MKIDLIAGARPNFVKIASIIHALNESDFPIQFRLIHTGQHYDETLSGSFFKDLELPDPDINLGTGSGSQAEQTAAIMMTYEKVLQEKKPNLCIVVGDVTSSMACAITAKKKGVKIAHVEAGLRSFDWTMPEEINRVLIDSITDYFFTTTREASDYLRRIGKQNSQIFHVGNTMIDTLLRFQDNFRKPSIWHEKNLKKGGYFILTLHRPSNVDEFHNLEKTITQLIKKTRGLPVIFPIHPRTATKLNNIDSKFQNLIIIPPLGYLEFNYLVKNSYAVITDSGGITEETTILGIPCITLRENTERPETITIGTNELVGSSEQKINLAFDKLFNNDWKEGSIPELWDGKTGYRILQALMKINE